ncbi:MAG: hypothetical protein WCK67_05125 [bacterium]
MSESFDSEDKILRTIGLELMFSTPQSREHSDGMTSIEIAKKCKLKLDIVKKKLKILQDVGIVRVIGINPKLWVFDDYNFQRISVDNPVYNLLCQFEDVDFCRYFDYSKD